MKLLSNLFKNFLYLFYDLHVGICNLFISVPIALLLVVVVIIYLKEVISE